MDQLDKEVSSNGFYWIPVSYDFLINDAGFVLPHHSFTDSFVCPNSPSFMSVCRA